MLKLNIDVKLVRKLLEEGFIVNSHGREAIVIDVHDVDVYRKDEQENTYVQVNEIVSNL